MSKRIVLLSDGTGNSAGKVWRTNVWRLFSAIDLKESDQIASYDDGVGSSSFKPLAILGGVFGWGLRRNVINLYKFLSRNYISGDRIYGFGFSRGAFTIRVLIGLVLDQGLVDYTDEADLDKKAKAAYRAYRYGSDPVWNLQFPFRWVRYLLDKRFYKPNARPVESIEFLGLWDTVAAYGLPIDEMTRGVSQWIWPLELPNRTFNKKIIRARHALAIDDERATFHPVLWDENKENTKPAGNARPTKDEQLLQVWFTGVHSNVGGGYPDDSLANISLSWILAEAQEAGLRFKQFPSGDPDSFISADSAKDKDGRLYDSRSGLGSYYRYAPRRIQDFYDAMPAPASGATKPIPKIHDSVFGRIKIGAHLYAPIGLPKDYEVLRTSNAMLLPPDFKLGPHTLELAPNDLSVSEGAQSAPRHDEQDHVWNEVWRRRAIYFLTVFASLHLVLYPLYRDSYKFEELRTRLRFVSDAIRLLGSVLPEFATRWLDAYARDPAWFLVSAGLVVFLTWVSVRIAGSITDRMRRLWTVHLPDSNKPTRPPAVESKVRQVLKAAVAAVFLYLVVYPLLPLFLRPGGIPGDLITAYTAQPVRFVLAAFLVIYYTPEFVIRPLRRSWLYQNTIYGFKYRFAPILSVVGILFLAITLAGHFHFNVRDSFGAFCKPKKSQRNCMPLDLQNQGFSYSEADKKWTRKFDVDFSNMDRAGMLCSPAYVFLKTNDKYRVVVTKTPEGPAGNWTFWDEESYLGGQPVSHLSGMKSAVMALLFPLRRTFDRPWGAFILRTGSTGTEESFLDRNQPRQTDKLVSDNRYPVLPKETLAEILTPRRDGELYFYLNRPVVGLNGYETFLSRHIGVTGKASILIEALNGASQTRDPVATVPCLE